MPVSRRRDGATFAELACGAESWYGPVVFQRYPLCFSLRLAAVCLSWGSPARALTRYVAVGGGTSGTGTTLAQPWSLGKACTAAVAGDLVLVQPGVYGGKFEITVSGTETAPITFRADGAGGTVVIDGTGIAGANDGLIFIRATNSKPLARDLIVDGFELRNFRNVNDASGVRILCQGNGTVARINVRNCYIHEIRGTNAMGITVYGQSSANAISGVTIEGCEVANCQPSPSEAVVFNGNVDGFTVKDCYIRDCNNIGLDMIGGEPGFPAAPTAGRVARNGLVQRCRVANIVNSLDIAAAGIYVDGGRLITIEHCLVETSDFGIEIGSENSGIVTDGVVVRNNILRNNRLNALVVGGAGSGNGRVNNCRFYHNLFWRNGTADVYATELFLQYGSGHLFENNIIHPAADVLPSFLYVIGGNTNQTFRNNLWFTPGGSANSEGDFGWIPEEINPSNPCCGSYQEFRARTSQDAGGLYANPLFINAAAGDYHLAAASPARNAGVSNPDLASGLLTDVDGLPRVQGTAPDMGPDEAWPVDAWWRAAFPAVPLSAAQLAADPDGDGAPNLLEYLGGSLPGSARSSPGYGPWPVGSSQGFFFEKAVSIADAEMRLWESTELTAWALSPVVPLTGAAAGGRQRMDWTLPGPPVPRIFLRGEARLKP